MGNKNSGPRTAPRALKILRGVTRKDRLNPHEPTIEVAPASFEIPPPELDGDERAIAEWIRIVPMLRRIGLVTELERGLLIALCQQWSRYLAGREHPQETGADKALTHCHKLWLELGFTSSSRSKMMAITPEAPTAKWAGML